MTTTVTPAPLPEFAQAANSFKRVINATAVRAKEQIQSVPMTATLAVILGSIK